MAKNKMIEALTADVERLMKLHDSAVAEIAELREKSEEQRNKIRHLQEQLKEAKAEAAKASLREAIEGNTANKSVARAHINRLLREVDKCIDMVSNRI